MPVRRFRSSARRGRSRRKLVWANRDVNFTIAANGNKFNIDLLADYRTLAGADTVGATVMRVHLRWWATGTVTNGDGVAGGLIVLPLNQVTAAQSTDTMVVDPVNSPNVNWMYINKWNAHPTYGFQAANNNIELDVKAKRRLDEVGNTLIWSMYNQDVAAPSFPVAVYSRVLLALP